MEDMLTLTFPKGAPEELVREIQSEVGDMEGVAGSGELGTRGLDVLTIGVWVKLAGDPAGLADYLVEVIRKLFVMMRERGIKGAKLTVGANVIELGDMDAEIFEETMARLKAAAG